MEMDLKNLKRAIDQVSEEKSIDAKKVLEAIESSIAAAYKKEYEKKGEIIKASLDTKNGAIKFWQLKTVVDETTVRFEEEKEVDESQALDALEFSEKDKIETTEDEDVLPKYNAVRHIILKDAKKIKKDVKLGDDLEFPLEPKEDFGRIAAQAAKQVILQKLREAERDSIVSEFKDREGEVLSGVVQRFERGNTYIDLGRATGVMPYREGIPGEHYRIGERLKFYIAKVDDESRVPAIILSRSDENFVRRLFEVEIPEIQEGLIEIKGIAREAGSRSKVAVSSSEEGIDPVGSCVGQRGTRIMAVSNELGQEKIDVIEYSEDPIRFISAALSPAEVDEVRVEQDKEAVVIVPDDELSLAIGRGGQNVRLAAKLTEWKIDVRSASNPNQSHAERVEKERAEREADAKKESDDSDASDPDGTNDLSNESTSDGTNGISDEESDSKQEAKQEAKEEKKEEEV